MSKNYQKELDALLASPEFSGRMPTLLLHSCCGPCSSYVLEYLTRHFLVTVFYYNPNIHPAAEYEKRLGEQKRLLREADFAGAVGFLPAPYDPAAFFDAAKGLEEEPEGGRRCAACFRLRLGKTAGAARDRGFEYFSTTLSVSPHKNAELINEIGRDMEREIGVKYLCADFKKRNGYQRSIQLSAEYGLYRQDYCGCVYSLR